MLNGINVIITDIIANKLIENITNENGSEWRSLPY